MQDAAEEYDKLCKALSRMVDCLPQVELYTETFLDSDLVRACVNAYYFSTLRFWTRACKFYRRHRLLNFIRVIWNDFDAEFSELEIAMIDSRDRVQRMPPACMYRECLSWLNFCRGCACRTYQPGKGCKSTPRDSESHAVRGADFGAAERDHSLAGTCGI